MYIGICNHMLYVGLISCHAKEPTKMQEENRWSEYGISHSPDAIKKNKKTGRNND
jgi:hypothetical protein